jgi:hypothetical protein
MLRSDLVRETVDRNRETGQTSIDYNDMKKFFVMLAVVFAVALLGQPTARAGGFFFPVPLPVPIFIGPGYFGPGYYAPGYYWGPGGYAYYRHPYWRHRYYGHGRWYYR